MRALALLLFSLAALAAPAVAQDIPGRVGRLAWFDGRVALYQDPDRGWEEPYVNYPITSENSLWTDADSRAELQVGPITLRMDENSQLDLSRIDDDTLDATLENGTMAIRVHHLRPRHVVRVSTTQASFLLEDSGRYRLDADPDRGESRLSVFAGEARMEAGNATVRIRAGDSVVVWGEDRPAYAFQQAYLSDFDRWAMTRDDRRAERRAPEYVSYEMTGYEDLDEYGEWSRDPTYGTVWFPTQVSADWAPYRYGRWVYVRPWGWTWVDEEPWGYAPFHYGRWVHLRDRWAWCPGRRVDQPVWAPALVAFIGGSGWSASASTGASVVGWYPLAPSEPYRPWYRASRTYVNRVNTSVISVPDRVAREHREWNRDRAATVVRREAIAAQRPVQQARVNVPAQAVAAAPVIAAPANVLPSRNEAREAHRREGAGRAPGPQPQARAAPHAGIAAAPAAPGAAAKPSFAKPHVAPRPAPQGAAPPAPAGGPLARKPLPQAGPAAPAARTETRGEVRSPPANAAREAEQNRLKAEQDRTKAAREAEQARAKAEADRAKAAHKAQEDAAQEARRKAAEDAQQRATRAAEQDRAKVEQQRAEAARKAQQSQQAQQAAQEARRKAAEDAQQKAARAAEQNRAKVEQQRGEAARKAQQDAAQEARRKAADEAQQRAARAAEQERAKAARDAAQKARHAPPEEQGKGKEKEKEKDQPRGPGT